MKKWLLIGALLFPLSALAQVPAVNSGTASYPVSGTMAAILTGTTGSIGGGALLAGACVSGTVAVTGSTTAMTVSVTPNTYPGDGTLFFWLCLDQRDRYGESLCDHRANANV